MFTDIAINADDGVINGDLRNLGQQLDRIQEAGFNAVELSTGFANAIRAGRIIEAEVARAREVLRRYPFRYTLHGPCPLNLLRNPERASEVLEACLQEAAEFGAEVLVYHSAQIHLHDAAQGLRPLPSDQELADAWLRETEALQRFARRAEALGVLLALENRDPHRWEVATLARWGRSPAELTRYHGGMRLDLLAKQMADVGSRWVGLCLDVGHAFLAAPYWPEPDYLNGVRQAAPWVRHLHFHDNFGRLDDVSDNMRDRLIFGEADNHMPPGWGRIPLAGVLQALADVRYAGWVVAEVDDRYEPYFEEVLANTRALCASAASGKA